MSFFFSKQPNVSGGGESGKVKKTAGQSPLLQSQSKQHRPQSYRKEWESQFVWLRPVAGSDSKAFCRCCNTELVAEVSVLRNHSKSKKHTEKEKNLAPTQKSITQCLQRTSEKEKLETTVKTAEVKLAGFLAEHNIAMKATNHLVDVIKDIFSDSKTAQNMSLGTKVTAIAKHVIGDCYFESLSEILMRKKFSILVDESTEIGNVKTLCVVVRFFDEGTNRVQTRFWKLVQIFSEESRHFVREGATAERLCRNDEILHRGRRPTSKHCGVWVGWL
ncbi:hypothetical protein ATANTOWER_031368 [Ataeniobius toweri]|uniref:DUF4371 domain-containing protein n=1 Tax=Ataeniobius toweri TaxID=208326 RepID=A0ABU7BIP6_9TELE|nr:hypothetical protein [Ataeniobius toweri]